VPFVDVGSKELYYDEAGTGPALVLLHEGVADSSMWDDHVAALARRRRVIRYDQPGYGRSPLPPGPFSDVRDLDALLDGLGVDRASLVGASMGGRIALEYALEHPDRIDALVLVAPGLRDHDWSGELQRVDEQEEALVDAGDLEGAADLAVRVWVDGPRRRPEQVDASVRERVREMNLRAYAVQVRAFAADEPPGPVERLDPPASARLSEVRAPTLVVVPDADQPDIIAISERLAAGIPGARKVVFEGVAHLLPMERPAEFVQTVLDFLDEARA
jgi:pimeloyl-ACP methyl ester carboxylesterase